MFLNLISEFHSTDAAKWQNLSIILKDIFNQPPLDIVEGRPVKSKDNSQFPTSFSPKRCETYMQMNRAPPPPFLSTAVQESKR